MNDFLGRKSSKPGTDWFSNARPVSIFFIEPLAGRSPIFGRLSRQGATIAFSCQPAEHRISVVGEAPMESIKLGANAVEYRRP